MASFKNFFTKKVVLIILVSVIAAGGLLWVIIANWQPTFRSGIAEVSMPVMVSGNGTSSVMVDEYLYFVGGKTDKIAYGDNDYYVKGKISDSGIYRVQIQDSKPVLTYKYDNSYVDDNGDPAEYVEGDDNYNQKIVGIQDWEDINTKTDIKAVVPKIAGHSQTAMWVFGNYLIYTTPNNLMDSTGVLQSDYLDFYRVDLDGRHHTLIYTAKQSGLTTDDFTVWADATDNIYILVKEDKTLQRINVMTRAVTTISEEVTAVSFPKATQYRENNVNQQLSAVYGGVMAYVYFTTDRDSETNKLGNLLYRYQIGNADAAYEAELIGDNGDEQIGTTFTMLGVTPMLSGETQFVYYTTQTNSNQKAEDVARYYFVITSHNLADYRYVKSAGEILGIPTSKDLQIYANGFCVIDNILYRYLVEDDRIQWREQQIISDVTNVLAVLGDVIYVQVGNDVHILDVHNLDAVTDQVISLTITQETNDTAEENGDNDDNGSSELTFAAAVLYQPNGVAAEPLIYVHDAAYIRIYENDGTVSYLRYKNTNTETTVSD